ncbi:MAG: 50S ribosomal protein L11 methyltransferase [Bacteroidales bacterium]|nr:50S ribosomal protein L11 methyltransferase [Bacteroidales bacterium]
MDYIELKITVEPTSQEVSEIVIAQLAEIGFESFTENNSGINAYIRISDFTDETKAKLNELFLPDNIRISYQIEQIKDQNWNAQWESSFEPINVDNRCLVRASFHKNTSELEYDIIIDPKMAFGTGHHQTTYLMIEQILKADLKGKTVLDMGCGTGVLAILAEMRGAKAITAIDIDEWAYKNTVENIQVNNCSRIIPQCGDVRLIEGKEFNVILANINRNILLSDMKHYNDSLSINGVLIISGILKTDIEIIMSNAIDLGLIYQSTSTRDEWVTMSFLKSH